MMTTPTLHGRDPLRVAAPRLRAVLVPLLLGSVLGWTAPSAADGRSHRDGAHNVADWKAFVRHVRSHRKYPRPPFHRPPPQHGDGVLRFVPDAGKRKSVYAETYARSRWLVELNEEALGRETLRETRLLPLSLLPRRTLDVSQRRFLDQGEGRYSWIGRIEGDPNGYVIITRVGDKIGIRAMIDGRDYLVVPLNDGLHEVMQLDARAYPEGEGFEDVEDVTPAPHDNKRFPDALFTTLAKPDGPLELRKILIAQATSGERVFYPMIENGSVIDVMLVYTRESLERAWLIAANADLADFDDLHVVPEETLLLLLSQMAFDLANLSLLNSGIPTWFNLLHPLYEVDYEESDFVGFRVPSETMAAELAGFGDGKMDEVHTLRNQQAADIVVLITRGLWAADFTARCGQARKTRKAMNPAYPSQDALELEFAANAFAVVKIDCLPKLTLAHEIGHLMGARHDRFNYPDPPDTISYEDYGFGFTLHDPNSNQAVRTVMAYPDECQKIYPNVGCPLIPRWSNPIDTTQFGGEPLGISWGYADAADNARVLTKNREAVSRYRWWGCRLVDCP